MKKREKWMIGVTLAVVALALAFAFMPAGTGEDAAISLSSGDLSTARETFAQYKQTLKDKAKIEKEYQAIAFGQPEHIANQDPGETFQNQLSRLLNEQLGAKSPQVGSPKYSEIKNVDEYYFVNIEVQTAGTHEELMRLLQNMQQMGLLIQSFALKKENPLQFDAIAMEITVARLVKHDADSRKRLAWKRGRN